MGGDDLPDDLSEDLSAVARALFEAGTVTGVLERTVALSVRTIEGCDAAAVSMVKDGQVVSVAASEPIGVELDRLQCDADEGPGLDAVTNGGATYATDLADDVRWPLFGPAAARAGIRSAYAMRLADAPASALNLYARLPAAFGATDRAKGLIFATLAGIALDTAEEREGKDRRIANLQAALHTREVIGQAQGILIERERITGDEAFALLQQASQHLNVKLRDVAVNLVETGETPESGERPPST